jgi:hypothetical protein
MTDPAARQALEAMVAETRPPTATEVDRLAAMPGAALEACLWEFAREQGAASVPALTALADGRDRGVRRAARRTLYRLSQRGIAAPAAAPAARPIAARAADRPARAWVSGLDGSGARAAWIVFEGAWGALRLCSVIVSDVDGIVEAAGGDISKKRLDRELAQLRATQKLPWLSTDPVRVVGLVAEALALHAARGTAPPAEFARWRPLFEGAPPASPAPVAAEIDSALVERSVELLDLPELAGWFLDPAAVASDAVEMLQTRESRLVISDQIKAEATEAIVGRVVERTFTPELRRLHARRLAEMALVFEATDRGEAASLARQAAAALLDEGREPTRHPFARALARRALEVAAEVALGRLKLSDVSRAAGDPPPAAAPDAEGPRIVTG